LLGFGMDFLRFVRYIKCSYRLLDMNIEKVKYY
jgi:hypothetical protein